MSKGIKTDDDASVWAVMFVGHRGGIETVICKSKESALVYAWFHGSREGAPHITELPLVEAEEWRLGSHDEKFTDRGITVSSRRDRIR
jgi:hypothetical protein